NPIDPCNTHSGPNNLQNYPILTSASSVAGVTTITGSLNSRPSSPFSLDFYTNTECDPAGHGQGQVLRVTIPISTDSNCTAPFQVTLAGTPHSVSATATDANGNTSEFSTCLVLPAAFYTVTPCRLIDTRGPAGPLGGPALVANADRFFRNFA